MKENYTFLIFLWSHVSLFNAKGLWRKKGSCLCTGLVTCQGPVKGLYTWYCGEDVPKDVSDPVPTYNKGYCTKGTSHCGPIS